MAASPHWILALVELIFFAPSVLPLFYLLRTHRETGRSGWLFFLLFVTLQCTGDGMAVSAGQNGTPSSIAIIIVQVGLSPLMLGLAGAVHEYFKLSMLSTRQQAQKMAKILDVVFHIAVLAAVAIYAVGASQSFKQPPPPNAHTLSEAGVMLLLVLFVALSATFAFVAFRTKGTHTATPLFWSITISLVLLAIRIIYATVSAFNQTEPAFNPVTGKIALQAMFVFLPGALIIAAMVTGGVMTTHLEVYGAVPTTAPLTSCKRASDSSV